MLPRWWRGHRIFLGTATGLLAIESTASKPGGLAEALEFVVNFADGDRVTGRFTSGGKPSTLLYHGSHHEHGQWRPHYGVVLNAHLAGHGLGISTVDARPHHHRAVDVRRRAHRRHRTARYGRP